MFQKHSNFIFHENPSAGSLLVLRGRTDRQKNRLAEAKDGFSQFF